MEPGERPRRETPGRRETDEVLAWRVEQIEKQIGIFAPTAAIAALHTHQLDETKEDMTALREAVDGLAVDVNEVRVHLKGMSVQLALIAAFGSILGGGAVTLAVALITS